MPATPPPDHADSTPPAMIGTPPSLRHPIDPAQHALQSAQEWRDVFEAYVQRRMKELGVPKYLFGATDFDGDGQWKAFIAHARSGGNITDGISVDSGCLNPKLLKGEKGSRVFEKARLRDRIDAIIAHEYEEDRLGTHQLALKHGAKTVLPVSEGARKILRAMGR